MSAYFYDEALLRKLQNWTRGTNITITGVNDTRRLFEVVADTTNDKPVQLPLVTLSRNGGYTILNKQRRPITFDGTIAGKTQRRGVQLNAIPIELQYQIDIYARYLKECDEYARNFVFNIINFPHLEVEIPYEDANLHHYGNIRITSEVEDNSDISERFVSGQFTRMSIGINIDDAYLFDVRVRHNTRIAEVDLQLEDDEGARELIMEIGENGITSIG